MLKAPHPCAGHQGRFGGNGRVVGFFEHEISRFIWSKVNGGNTGMAPQPPQPPPANPVVLRMSEVQKTDRALAGDHHAFRARGEIPPAHSPAW
jgi:hypothetical protein